MLNNKLYILIGLLFISLSSCGIFKKDCKCPHFGYKTTKTVKQIAKS